MEGNVEWLRLMVILNQTEKEHKRGEKNTCARILTTPIVTDVTIVIVLALEQLQTGQDLILRLALWLWRSWKRNVGDLALAAFPSSFGNDLERRRMTPKVEGCIASPAPNHVFCTIAFLRTFSAFGFRPDHRNSDGFGSHCRWFVGLVCFILTAPLLGDDRQ